MRRAFIALGIVLFLIYCRASVVYQNQAPIPDYRLVEVDLLGGRTRDAWDASPQARFQRLMELEGGHYQLPAGAAVPVGPEAGPHVVADAKGNISPERALTSDDFAYLIASAPAGPGVRMRLRDASAIYDMLGRGYLLRDNIEKPEDRNEPPLYVGGMSIGKEMLDDLRTRGWKTITVVGHGAPVTFLPGTAIMVCIIFLTLVAALKPVVWDPFLALIEKRRRELEIGAEAERQNQLEASRFEGERLRRNAELYRAVQEARMRGQRETAREAEGIVREAREKEEAIKASGLRDIAASLRDAEAALEQDVPALAEAVADALTPGRGGPRLNSPDDGGEG